MKRWRARVRCRVSMMFTFSTGISLADRYLTCVPEPTHPLQVAKIEFLGLFAVKRLSWTSPSSVLVQREMESDVLR